MRLTDIIKKSGYYRVRVLPKSSTTELRAVMTDGTIKIAVAAPPEKGKANEALVDFVASELKISKSSVRISTGLASREKVIFIELDE